MKLFGWLREINGKQSRRISQGSRNATAQRDATTQPRLEYLEDRLAPAFISSTTTAAVGITPNFLTRTAIETITATVVSSGGTVAFNVNNQTSSAGLNGNGQAAFSATLPLFAVANNQTLEVTYPGFTDQPGLFFVLGSDFLAPVYLNVWNAAFPAQITFGTPTSTTSFQSSGGETDDVSVFGSHLKFNYVDPGRIDTISWLGFTFPGSFSAAFGVPQLG